MDAWEVRHDRWDLTSGRGMEPGVPEPPALYERFTVTYPSGTVIESFYADGATLELRQSASGKDWARLSVGSRSAKAPKHAEELDDALMF